MNLTKGRLAWMWCKLNAWEHPLSRKAKFPKDEVMGAMKFIELFVDRKQIMKTWNSKSFRKRAENGK